MSAIPIRSAAPSPRVTTGPDHWASYLISGDASGLAAEDKARADAWLRRENVRILDVARGPNGEPIELRFT